MTSYYEDDGLGSVTTLTNSAASVAQSYTYRTFGGVVAASGTITNPFQYVSRDFDSETGLVYMRARYFDSNSGRFVSEDPLQFNAGNNFYEYSYNNPVNFKDPTGLQTAPILTPAPSSGLTVIEGGGGAAAGGGTAAGGAGAAVTAATVGLAALDLGLLAYDSYETYKLGVAYGWWKPFPQPQPNSGPMPECKKTKWKCRVRCALIDLRTGSAVGFVETDGIGPTEGDAFYNGQKQLQNGTPRGFRTKHCHVVGKCQKQ